MLKERALTMGDTPVSEGDLLRQARRGNIHAYGAVYTQHAEKVFLYIRGQVDTPQQAEDLTEEVFVDAWAALETFSGDTSQFLALLFNTADAVISSRASKKRNGQKQTENRSRGEFREIIGQLPAPHRKVLLLRYTAGFSQKETARLINGANRPLKKLEREAFSKLKAMGKKQMRGDKKEIIAWLHQEREALIPDKHFLQRSTRRMTELVRIIYLKKTREEFKRQIRETSLRSRMLRVRFASALVLMLLLVFGSTGLAYAAQDDLPGDLLYGAKLTLEEIQLYMARSESARIELHLKFAKTRVEEVGQLITAGRTEGIQAVSKNLTTHLNALGGVNALLEDLNAEQVGYLGSVLETYTGAFAATAVDLSTQGSANTTTATNTSETASDLENLAIDEPPLFNKFLPPLMRLSASQLAQIFANGWAPGNGGATGNGELPPPAEGHIPDHVGTGKPSETPKPEPTPPTIPTPKPPPSPKEEKQ